MNEYTVSRFYSRESLGARVPGKDGGGESFFRGLFCSILLQRIMAIVRGGKRR